ncbi:MAG: sigma-70 family RNA polymerase sigma factor [Myxococcales bacterium]|nr:sigma-70 family RNA polymerase sigma factor [Myxococcales bacterium]MCB9652107.1 sigma-70 family RNA polymerase sigma factor [Deltaproteobacteria bacterium]
MKRRPVPGRRPGPTPDAERPSDAAPGGATVATAPEGPRVLKEPKIAQDFKSLPAPSKDMSRRELAEKYTPYVRSIAGKIKKTLSKDIEFDDLVSYGMLGLMEAADRFDPKHGANFMTFAYYRVRGAIYDGLRGMGWVSRTEYQRYRFEQHANAYLQNVHEQNAATPVGIKKSEDDEVGELANVVEGLVTIYVTALDAMEGFQIKDDRGPAIDETLEVNQARELVSAALEKLGGQEKQLLEMYYYKEMSLEEVGKQLGLSKSWTSRLHTRAIQKLSRLLKDLVDEYDEDRRPGEKVSPGRATGGNRSGGGGPSTQPSGPPFR